MITPSELRAARNSYIIEEFEIIEKKIVAANKEGRTSLTYAFSGNISVKESELIAKELVKNGFVLVTHNHGSSMNERYNYILINWG